MVLISEISDSREATRCFSSISSWRFFLFASFFSRARSIAVLSTLINAFDSVSRTRPECPLTGTYRLIIYTARNRVPAFLIVGALPPPVITYFNCTWLNGLNVPPLPPAKNCASRNVRSLSLGIGDSIDCSTQR